MSEICKEMSVKMMDAVEETMNKCVNHCSVLIRDKRIFYALTKTLGFRRNHKIKVTTSGMPCFSC